METKIENIINKVIGKTCWRAWRSVGSIIFFEIGNKITDKNGKETEHGEFSLCLYTYAYEIRQNYNLILSSNDSLEIIGSKIKLLEGQKLLEIEINKDEKYCLFKFSEGFNIFLPMSIKDCKWTLLTPNISLTVEKDCKITLEKEK